MIRFECPGCQAVYNVKDDKAGKTGKCPTCGSQFVIPTPEPEPVPVLPPLLPPPPEAPAPPAPVAFVATPVPRPLVAVAKTVEIAPCPGCGSRMSVMPSDLGVDVECPKCREVYRAKKPGTTALAPVARDERISRRAERDADEFEDDRPRRRRRTRRRDDDESWVQANKKVFRIVSGCMSLLTGAFQLLCGIGALIGGISFLAAVGGLSTQANNPNAGNMLGAIAGVGTMVLIGCGLVSILFALFYILSGIAALTRKEYGRVLTIIVGICGAIWTMVAFGRMGMSLINLELVAVVFGFLQFLYAAVHALSSFFAAIGAGADREFNQ